MRDAELLDVCAAVRAMGAWGEAVGWELARQWLADHGFTAAACELPAAGAGTCHTPLHAHHMAHDALDALVSWDVRARKRAGLQGLLPICKQATACEAIVNHADPMLMDEAKCLAGAWPELAWEGDDDGD